jgi:hypothetical protein
MRNGRGSGQGELEDSLSQLADSAWAVWSAVGSNRGSNGTRPGSEGGRNRRLATKDPVRQPTVDKGRAAGRLLFQADGGEPAVVYLDYELVVRDSTGPPRASR